MNLRKNQPIFANEQIQQKRTIGKTCLDVEKQTTLGGIVMEKRDYTHMQVLLPESKQMLAEVKNQRQVAECYGFFEAFQGFKFL